MAKRGYKPAIEALEDRCLLAVNAFFNAATNSLVVQGNGAHDTVEISQDDDQLLVRARGGTALSINGGTATTNGRAAFDVTGQFNIVVNLGGGNDKLTVEDVEDFEPDEGTSPGLGNLIIETAQNNDRVTVHNVEGDNLLINAGSDVNTVELTRVEMNNQIDISSANSADRVNLRNVEVGDDDDDGANSGDPTPEAFLTAAAAAGIYGSSLTAFGAEVGIDIHTGGGNDRIDIEDIQVGDNNTGTTAYQLVLDTAGGNDRVDIRDSEFRHAVDINMGADNDTLDIRESEFESTLKANGASDTASGQDRLVLVDNEFALTRAAAPAISGFEHTTINDNEFSGPDNPILLMAQANIAKRRALASRGRG